MTKPQSLVELPNTKKRDMTRRQLLQTFGAGAFVGTIFGSLPDLFTSGFKGYAGSTQPNRSEEILGVTTQRAIPFNVADVQLQDGPFRRAQELNGRYLLTLEPDRLLHNFRVNAGLTPKAPIYGGWESVEPWIEIRCHGHTLGHYLSACSLMFASTGDQRFKQRLDYIVTELHDCQEAGKTGLVCAFPDGDTQFRNMASGNRVIGVPWYTMHKIFAGLRDAYLIANNRLALEVLVKLSDWAIGTTEKLTDEQFQRMLNIEHGGMNEVLADVYAITRESRYLTLARRFCHRAVLTPFTQSRDILDGLHSNTQIPKFVGFNRLFELTGESEYQKAAQFFWHTVVENRAFATGGNGDREHFFPPADFLKHLSSAKTMETCCTYNMLRLTRSLFGNDPSAKYFDYYERALYNSILASQDPESGMMTYFQPTRPGYLKLYCTPTDSFWCCTGSGIENHAKYGDSIYFHDADSLFVNLFIPSKLEWKEKGLTVTQSTRFPEQDKTSLTLGCAKPIKLTLNIRHPSWCQTVTIKVNGRRFTTSRQPGRYIAVSGLWKSGDIIEVHLPQTLRTEALPGNPDVVAILYGPIVLAGRLGSKGLTAGADIIVNERTTGDVLNEEVEVPVLRGRPSELLKQIRPSKGSPLTFHTNGIGDPHDVTLIPYYRIAHERYNLYWKIGTSNI